MFSLFKKKKEASRKEKSEALLEKHRIKINYSLPHIEDDTEVTIRRGNEIASRFVILCITNLVAFDNLSATEAFSYLQEYNLTRYLTPDEQAFLSHPTPETKSQESWKCECIWVLAWALRLVDDLKFPDHLCNLNDIAEADYPIGNGKNPNDFINKNWDVRPKTVVLDAADLYYRMDWTVVDARLNGRVLENLNPGVVYERHYALNWLINYMGQDWDDISCDT